MDYLDHPFEVSTGSCRRPTPLTYEHLKKWTDPVSHSLPITSIDQLQNVNQYLDQQATLYISNIIQQVIAQIIGQYGDGFKTIKATEDGALHTYLADAAAALDILATLQAGTNMIGSVEIAGPAPTPKSAKINITTTGTHEITTVAPSTAYYITSIMFTVDGECTVCLWDESAALSGVMNFGATGQPMGMTHSFGFIPLACTAGEKFQIVTVGASINVKGVITYYDA